jgi:dihydrofolate reductase
MTQLRLDITNSLDGFVAGPKQTLEQPLGEGGAELHRWLFENAGWRERHGLEGGEETADTVVIEESLRDIGAVVMGRRMFSGGRGNWDDDPNAGGWWGDDPPFHVPVFVLTHHPREPLTLRGGTSFTFVADGIESALGQARGAANGGDVSLAGGANVAQQYLAAGLVDQLQVHVAPVLLGDGVRLFGKLDQPVALDRPRVVAGPRAAHLAYRIGGRA